MPVKNISVIRTIVCDPFLSFPIEKVPVIRTFFFTPDSVLITGIYCITITDFFYLLLLLSVFIIYYNYYYYYYYIMRGVIYVLLLLLHMTITQV